MGFNSTILVHNDSLHAIQDNPKEFVDNMSHGILGFHNGSSHLDKDISCSGHCNAASVVAVHHADDTYVLAVGGNYGTILHQTFGNKHHEDEDKLRLVKEMARALGFDLRKRK